MHWMSFVHPWNQQNAAWNTHGGGGLPCFVNAAATISNASSLICILYKCNGGYSVFAKISCWWTGNLTDRIYPTCMGSSYVCVNKSSSCKLNRSDHSAVDQTPPSAADLCMYVSLAYSFSYSYSCTLTPPSSSPWMLHIIGQNHTLFLYSVHTFLIFCPFPPLCSYIFCQCILGICCTEGGSGENMYASNSLEGGRVYGVYLAQWSECVHCSPLQTCMSKMF